tara:strand:+ start:479 stop:829 length:351 start_codon:yes stop_codon:yes gene_type:complete
MIWQRLPIIRSFFGAPSPDLDPVGAANVDHAAADVAARWQRAFTRDPELSEDLIRLSGLMVVQPIDMKDGYPQPSPIDPYRLAYEAGRRDFALLLLAQGNISHFELSQMMESLDVR